MSRFVLCAVAAIFAAVPCLRAQATLASLDGTYTFVLSNLSEYSPEFNWAGHQVGFCNGSVPFGYHCGYSVTLDVITGTLVADGAGHVTSGSFTQTNDPNSYECNPNNNPTNPCPVMLPSDSPYSATEAYSVCAVVDFTVGTTTRTFQAVRASTGKPPKWGNTTDNAYICTNNNLNTCYWNQVYASLTNSKGSGNSGTFTGTYTINSNGSGTLALTLKPSGCTTNCTQNVSFALVVSPASSVGQTVHLSGESALGNHNRIVGGATRIK